MILLLSILLAPAIVWGWAFTIKEIINIYKNE